MCGGSAVVLCGGDLGVTGVEAVVVSDLMGDVGAVEKFCLVGDRGEFAGGSGSVQSIMNISVASVWRLARGLAVAVLKSWGRSRVER